MKFKSVKKASEVTLEGITVELDTVDGSIKGVILTDAKGNTLRVIERTYSLFVEVPAPPEMEKKYRLSGNLLGLPVNMNFDSKYEADAEQERLERGIRGDESELKVEEVEVPVAV